MIKDDVAFVKMDIEGAEIEALKGAKRHLMNGTLFAIASYHIIDGKESYAHLHNEVRL